MKKNIIILSLLLASTITGKSQTDSTYQETLSYGLDEYIEKCTDIPLVRKINGGTIFNVSYGDGWTAEMKGAFEYACKIWEETLPNCPPINIRAEIGTIRSGGTGKTLSKVTSPFYRDLGYYNYDESALRCQIKAAILKEFINGANGQFIDGIDDLAFFEETDFTITYNKNLLNDFSYSLYSTPTDKYDFVTMVLRDIARGLGFSSSIRGSETDSTIYITGEYPTRFEQRIWTALDTEDPQTAYIKGTQGLLQIYGEHIQLYAPTEWVNGISLNTFIPDSTVRLTELLSYQFGKGSIVRNIASNNYPNMFENLLGWWGDILTGVSPTTSISGSTENVISFGGNISLESSVTLSSNTESVNNSTYSVRSATSIDVDDYCKPYHPAYIPAENQCKDGWSVAILKKDGTWDVVYYNSNYYIPLNVNMNDFEFNYADTVYSRTCDGHLRCRVTHSYGEPRKVYEVTYFALDYLPQVVDMEFSGVVSALSTLTVMDDYYRDIKIGIKNLEGIDRIVVEQLDEGNIVPYTYEVSDFKNGYFIATVNKEFYTELTVISYNENGSTRSETLEIEPLEPADEVYAVQISDNTISIQSVNDRVASVRQLVSYEVIPINQYSRTTGITGNINNNITSIDISALGQGTYVLNYYDCNHNKYSIKFEKQ